MKRKKKPGEDPFGKKLKKFSVAELKQLLGMTASKEDTNKKVEKDLVSSEAVPDIHQQLVLCMNASNDAGATSRNPEPPNQPMWFQYPLPSKKE